MAFILRYEKISYFRKYSKKPDDRETFPAEDKRDVLRNKSHRTSVWDTVITFLFHKTKKDIDDTATTENVGILLLKVSSLTFNTSIAVICMKPSYQTFS